MKKDFNMKNIQNLKKNLVLFLIFALCASFCLAQTSSNYLPKIDVDSARKNYAKKITITPMDGVTISDGLIVLEPKKEETSYTISGYFNGQIENRTKNTEIKLKNAFIENNSGKPALYAQSKVILSTVKDTINYVVSDYVVSDGVPASNSSEKVSFGQSPAKSGAVHCKKNLVLGGSGILYVIGGVYHAVKADDVKIKGSGIFYLRGTEKGSCINCHSLAVEKDKSFKAYFLASKNGIKADSTISIASGNFYFYDNGTAMKTDTVDENSDENSDKNRNENHGITIYDGKFVLRGNDALYETDKNEFKSRVKF